MTRPYTTDPITALALPRNQRDRLRRAVEKVQKDIPEGMEIRVTSAGWRIAPVLERSERLAAIAELVDG
mgnify:CR=1 FL=1